MIVRDVPHCPAHCWKLSAVTDRTFFHVCTLLCQQDQIGWKQTYVHLCNPLFHWLVPYSHCLEHFISSVPEAVIKGKGKQHQKLWDVIICPCSCYLHLAQHSLLQMETISPFISYVKLEGQFVLPQFVTRNQFAENRIYCDSTESLSCVKYL